MSAGAEGAFDVEPTFGPLGEAPVEPVINEGEDTDRGGVAAGASTPSIEAASSSAARSKGDVGSGPDSPFDDSLLFVDGSPPKDPAQEF
jgi:hypothetical protein